MTSQASSTVGSSILCQRRGRRPYLHPSLPHHVHFLTAFTFPNLIPLHARIELIPLFVPVARVVGQKIEPGAISDPQLPPRRHHILPRLPLVGR